MKEIRNRKITLIAVGVTDKVDEALLKKIVTAEDYYFPVTHFNQLAHSLDQVISQACVTIKPPEPTLPDPAGKYVRCENTYMCT